MNEQGAITTPAQRASMLLAQWQAMEAGGFKNLSVPEIQQFSVALKEALCDVGLLIPCN